MDGSVAAESLRLWNYLKENYDGVIENPLAFDGQNKTNAKLSRALKDEIAIPDLKRKLKISKLKVSWGDGSRGNRGTRNTGNLFEAQLENGLNDWIETGDYSKNPYKDFIKELIKTYNLDDCSYVLVNEGPDNKKRPIVFEGSGWKIGNATASNYDIGAIVTDLTLHTKCKGKAERKIYLSLKKGGTTTMSNLGVKKIFPKGEIESGEIKNNVGKKVLETFGIENERFCAIFNQAKLGKIVSGGNVDNPKFNRTLLQSMIRGSIGYGYHYTHMEKGNNIKNFPMTKQVCDAATSVNSVVVHYGGKSGTGQRIDITVGTPAMELKFNIRDTSGASDEAGKSLPWPDKLQSGYKFNMETVYSIPSDGYDD